MNIDEQVWKCLLTIKSTYPKINNSTQYFYIDTKYKLKIINKNNPTTKFENNLKIQFINTDSSIILQKYFIHYTNKDFWDKIMPIFNLYLPIIFYNKKSKIPLVFCQTAQSVDGKIATSTGNSKWIGNKENLIHAHRLRALTYGILVGAETFRLDKPKLTVRNVKGKNPVKIILTRNINTLELSRINTGLIIIPKDKTFTLNLPKQKIISVPLNNNQYNLSKLCLKLKEKLIHTVFIEGGAFTISQFINQKLVQIIQYHIAPLIIGSGKNSLYLKEINTLDETLKFSSTNFINMGNGVMFTGIIN